MNDGLAAFEGGEGFGAEQTVGIGDDAEEERFHCLEIISALCSAVAGVRSSKTQSTWQLWGGLRQAVTTRLCHSPN